MITLISRLLAIAYDLMIRLTLRAYRIFTRALSWNPSPPSPFTEPKKRQPDQVIPKSNPRVEDKYCVIEMEGASCQSGISAGASTSQNQSESHFMGDLSPTKKAKTIRDTSSDKRSVKETPTVVATTIFKIRTAEDIVETSVDVDIVEFSNDQEDARQRMLPQPVFGHSETNWSLSSPNTIQKNVSSSETNQNQEIRSKIHKSRIRRKKQAKAREFAPPLSIKNMARPNCFIGFQITNSETKANIESIQDRILKKDNIFKDSMIPIQKSHFTLHVINVKDYCSIASAKSILEDCFIEVKKTIITEPMHLCIEGLGHFGNKVLFAKIKGAAHISQLEGVSLLLRDKFRDMKISEEETKSFKPHTTIAKLSRSKTLHKNGIRSFPLEIWEEFANEHVGSQKLESMQLLSMTEPADPETGYYKCYAEFFF